MGGCRRSNGKYNFEKLLQSYKIIDLYKHCLICGWDKAHVDWCHIIPDYKWGDYSINNIVPLCPNHHRVLDHGSLMDYEIQSITDFIYRIYAIVEKIILLDESKAKF